MQTCPVSPALLGFIIGMFVGPTGTQKYLGVCGVGELLPVVFPVGEGFQAFRPPSVSGVHCVSTRAEVRLFPAQLCLEGEHGQTLARWI